KALNEIEEVRLNGARDFERRHPNNLNLTFKYVEGESVVLYLDMKGVSVITGSACFSRTLEPSYILMAMGYSHEDAHGSVRFTFSKFNTTEEIDYTIDVLKSVIDTLRKLSPLKGE
ncbi:MAG: aminotransferase class V-fold PLP-dependent enzyme, partial [Candidatus Hydrothermae bacterium]|nr:aminotransferase class V-fold PLP-dependent enzyme [Candidatus Hydrothermae bacterium]